MAYDVKETWSQRDITHAAESWGAAKYYSVVGTTIAEMMDDRAVVLADGIPRIGQSHEASRDLRVVSVSAGPGLVERIVTVRYGWVPAGGTSGGDLINTKPRISVQRLQRTDNITHDVRGNLIVNAANDPFEGITIERWSRLLTYVRYERGWNADQADVFEDSVSKYQMVIGGRMFPAGAVRFISSNPVGEFDVDAPIIPIAYELELRGIGRDSVAGITTGSQETLGADAKRIIENPFLWWVPNVGTRALLQSGQPADIYYKSSQTSKVTDRVSEPVALSLTGRVANSATFALSINGLTEATAGGRTGSTPWVLSATINNLVFLGYQIHRTADLRLLAL